MAIGKLIAKAVFINSIGALAFVATERALRKCIDSLENSKSKDSQTQDDQTTKDNAHCFVATEDVKTSEAQPQPNQSVAPTVDCLADQLAEEQAKIEATLASKLSETETTPAPENKETKENKEVFNIE